MSIELRGQHTKAIVYNDLVDNTTISQVIEFTSQPYMKDIQVRIMPDCHAGKGAVIGTTFQIKNAVSPSLVGVDIGCGMQISKIQGIKAQDVDLEKLDKNVHACIPSGQSVHVKALKDAENLIPMLSSLKILQYSDRDLLSLGTLGGGNHFIELNKDDEDNVYLVIHSGSRNLGKRVAEAYIDLAYRNIQLERNLQIEVVANALKVTGKQAEIHDTINKLKREFPNYSKDLAPLINEDLTNYLHDMNICQKYASMNRFLMTRQIIHSMGWHADSNIAFETIHNYIDSGKMLRKGAVSAQNGEKLLIPLNMRDGSLICTGLGNAEWNCSAPHGAGRKSSRAQAKANLSLEQFKEEMNGIYSTCINHFTLDESPMAYKDTDEIINLIKDKTVKIDKQLKPIYNYKSH